MTDMGRREGWGGTVDHTGTVEYQHMSGASYGLDIPQWLGGFLVQSSAGERGVRRQLSWLLIHYFLLSQ